MPRFGALQPPDARLSLRFAPMFLRTCPSYAPAPPAKFFELMRPLARMSYYHPMCPWSAQLSTIRHRIGPIARDLLEASQLSHLLGFLKAQAVHELCSEPRAPTMAAAQRPPRRPGGRGLRDREFVCVFGVDRRALPFLRKHASAPHARATALVAPPPTEELSDAPWRGRAVVVSGHGAAWRSGAQDAGGLAVHGRQDHGRARLLHPRCRI
jgi:hypothetical protein